MRRSTGSTPGKGRQRKQDGAKEETELQCSHKKPQSTGCGALERRLPVTGFLVGLTLLGLSLPRLPQQLDEAAVRLSAVLSTHAFLTIGQQELP